MKTHPEWPRPKTKKPSRSGIPAKKIRITTVAPDEKERFDTLCGDLHDLGAARPVSHFLRQVAVFEGEWIALLARGPPCYVSGHLKCTTPAQRKWP